MKRIVHILFSGLMVVGLFFLAACAAPTKTGEFTKHYDDTSFEVTQDKQFSVELLHDYGTLTTGDNNFQVVIHDKHDKDVPGAGVSATAYKPGNMEATKVSMDAKDRGDGLYTFSGFTIDSPGHWKLEVQVSKGSKQSTAVFDYTNVQAPSGKAMTPKQMEHMHKDGSTHDHSKSMTVERPEDIDTTRTVTSEKGHFTVSYEPMKDDLPVGTIHSWKMRIMDKQGNPVTAAKIVIDGDMPEHGHGLPTQPKVTKNLGNGYYQIDGMKFSMPGWWVMEFRIFTAEANDMVKFNLLLE